MKAVVLVPYRSDGAERDRNWAYAHIWWLQLGLPVLASNGGGARFERSQARNRAAAQAGDWEVALFADADIILGSPDQADAALMRSYRTGAYTVAYSQLNYLTEQGTQDLAIFGDPAACESDESLGLTWECCFAIRRDIWDKVGGFDERFRGYGGQVAAFFYAYATFGGRERISGQAYHLAHPLVNRDEEPHYQANCELAERYRAAVGNPHTMLEILAER